MNPQTDGGMMGEEILGGLAELVIVPARNLVRLPDTLSFETAAAIPINYGTAHRMLYTRGRLAAGETMLVLGASGRRRPRLPPVRQDDRGDGDRRRRFGREMRAADGAGRRSCHRLFGGGFLKGRVARVGQEGLRRGGQLHRRRHLGALPQNRQAGRPDTDLRRHGGSRPRPPTSAISGSASWTFWAPTAIRRTMSNARSGMSPKGACLPS